MEQKLDKSTVGFSLAYIIASLFSAVLVPIKEEIAPIKDAMKAFTGHHWATHGLLTIGLFIILGYVFSKESYQEKYDAQKLTSYIIWTTVIAAVIISGYMLIHFFSH